MFLKMFLMMFVNVENECFGKGQEVLSYPAVSRLSNWSNIVQCAQYIALK